jgi:hypothetical protein
MHLVAEQTEKPGVFMGYPGGRNQVAFWPSQFSNPEWSAQPAVTLGRTAHGAIPKVENEWRMLSVADVN